MTVNLLIEHFEMSVYYYYYYYYYTELFADSYGVVWYDETCNVDYGDEDGKIFLWGWR